MEARLAKNQFKSKAEIHESRMIGMRKAIEARKLKLEQRKLVEKKIEMGLPISEQERELVTWKGGNRTGNSKENRIKAAAAALVIKPQSVTALRTLVESTAAKHKYNPIEELILMTKPDASGRAKVDAKDAVAIHKALLPFLVPQLAAPKAGSGDANPDGQGIKVVVTQFQFPDRAATSEPLHQQRPATVATTEEQSAP